MDLNATKKLFHAVVVIGMAATASCSSGSTTDPQDAASNDSSSSKDSSSSNDSGSTKDVAVADTGGGTDAGGDGFTGWLGC